jgi:hypothetical protein
MTKKLFFILIFSLFICKQSISADCLDIDINPQIKIISSYGKLSYDTGKNTYQITELAKKFNLVENGVFASGLSTVNINFDVTTNTIGKPVSDYFCVIPTEINIFLGLDNPIIYLSKELEKNSCEYKLVLRHEQTHQQINKTTLEYYLPLFKEAVLKIVKKTSPILIKNINELEKSTGELSIKYNNKITPLVDFIKKEMLNEQRKLDNPNNYLFEDSLCSKH